MKEIYKTSKTSTEIRQGRDSGCTRFRRASTVSSRERKTTIGPTGLLLLPLTTPATDCITSSFRWGLTLDRKLRWTPSCWCSRNGIFCTIS